MAEPTSTTGASVGLLYLFTVAAGPLLGPYAYILFGATLGAATALSAAAPMPGWDGFFKAVWFLLRVAGIALLFTVSITVMLQQITSLPFEFLMGAVAYAIGWRWDTLLARFWPWILSKLPGTKEVQP